MYEGVSFHSRVNRVWEFSKRECMERGEFYHLSLENERFPCIIQSICFNSATTPNEWILPNLKRDFAIGNDLNFHSYRSYKFYKYEQMLLYLRRHWEPCSRSSSRSSDRDPSRRGRWGPRGSARRICSTACSRATVHRAAVRETWQRGARWWRCSEDRPVAWAAPASAWTWREATGPPASSLTLDSARSRLAAPKEGKACYWTALSTSAFLSRGRSLAGWRSAFRHPSASGTAAWTRTEAESSARFSVGPGRSPGRVDPGTCCAWQAAWREWASGDLAPSRCPGPRLRSSATRFPSTETPGSLLCRSCSRRCRGLQQDSPFQFQFSRLFDSQRSNNDRSCRRHNYSPLFLCLCFISTYWSSKIKGRECRSPSNSGQCTGSGGNEARYRDLRAASLTAWYDW